MMSEMEWMDIFAGNLRSLMDEGRMSQKELARKTGISKGTISRWHNGECLLFPSKDQRDWSKFTAPWYKKEKFDPKTLKPFDKVLVRISNLWRVNFFSANEDGAYRCIDYSFIYCIPYNDDTKHLVGTTKEAPEYYKYWEGKNNE